MKHIFWMVIAGLLSGCATRSQTTVTAPRIFLPYNTVVCVVTLQQPEGPKIVTHQGCVNSDAIALAILSGRLTIVEAK